MKNCVYFSTISSKVNWHISDNVTWNKWLFLWHSFNVTKTYQNIKTFFCYSFLNHIPDQLIFYQICTKCIIFNNIVFKHLQDHIWSVSGCGCKSILFLFFLEIACLINLYLQNFAWQFIINHNAVFKLFQSFINHRVSTRFIYLLFFFKTV